MKVGVTRSELPESAPDARRGLWLTRKRCDWPRVGAVVRRTDFIAARWPAASPQWDVAPSRSCSTRVMTRRSTVQFLAAWPNSPKRSCVSPVSAKPAVASASHGSASHGSASASNRGVLAQTQDIADPRAARTKPAGAAGRSRYRHAARCARTVTRPPPPACDTLESQNSPS
jgi:hypothetical protein